MTTTTRDPANLTRLRDAIHAYLDALSAADRAHSTLGDAIRQAAIPGIPYPAVPMTGENRQRVARILDYLPTPEEYAAPTHRRLRGTNGIAATIPVQRAREMVRDGLVEEWLDGLPPEPPAPPVPRTGDINEAYGLTMPGGGGGGINDSLPRRPPGGGRG